MNIICHHCNTKLTIPDHKIPRDKASTFKCPKCKEKIQVPAIQQQTSAMENQSPSFQPSLKEHLNALVCIDGKEFKEKVVSIAGQMGLAVETAADTKLALDKMAYRICHLVIIDADFDENKGVSEIVDRMNAIDMSLRRRVCLVLISNQFKTNDQMAALHSSVNSIIHPDDILHLKSFLSRVLAEHEKFYTVYNDSLKLTGKA